MTFDPNIPEVPSSPSTVYLPIQTNFDQFANIFSNTVGGIIYNHLPLNDPNQGKHGAILMQNQSAAPGVTGDLAVLFSMNAISNVTPLGQPQLFAQILPFLPNTLDTTKAANIPMQLTYNSVGTSSPYYSFLAGGYLLYFDKITVNTIFTPSPVPTSILCALAFPTSTGGSNIPYNSFVTVNNTAKTVFIGSGGNNPAPGGSTFFYLVIAKA